MKNFKHYAHEGIWGDVGQKTSVIKKRVVRATFPHSLRVGIAALTSTGKAKGYADDVDTKKSENMIKWRNEILSGKRKLRG